MEINGVTATFFRQGCVRFARFDWGSGVIRSVSQSLMQLNNANAVDLLDFLTGVYDATLNGLANNEIYDPSVTVGEVPVVFYRVNCDKFIKFIFSDDYFCALNKNCLAFCDDNAPSLQSFLDGDYDTELNSIPDNVYYDPPPP